MDAPGEKLVLRLWETLIEKGIGSLLTPWQERRAGRARIDVKREERLALAQAEQDIKEIRAGRKRFTTNLELVENTGQDQAEAKGASTRTVVRTAQTNVLLEQMQTDVNIGRAILQAEAELEDGAQVVPDRTIDDDWFIRWRDSAGKVSSDTLQTLWGRVLAGEIESPGAFSLRTLEFLKNLSQKEAQRIEKLGPFVINSNDSSFVFSGNVNALESKGIPLKDLIELKDLGIITQATPGLQIKMNIPETGLGLFSHNRVLVVERKAEKTEVKVAAYPLTAMGKQVIRLGSFRADEDYLRRVGKEVKQQGFKVVVANYVPESESHGRYFNEEEL